MNDLCRCGRATVEGVCLECMFAVDECQCERAGVERGPGSSADIAPHPADDPREVARRRGLRVVTDADRAEDDDAATLEAIPAYPVGALVGPMADFVGWAVKDGLVASAAGAAALAALATVAGRSELMLSGTVAVRPALWVAPVGNTGTGKSPALDQAFAAVSALYDVQRNEYDAECEASDGKPEMPKPRPPTLGDATMPAVARWLKQTGGSGCLVYDELAALLAEVTKDPAGRAKLCEMWTARRPVHIQRVGSGGGSNEVDVYISRPVLSVIGPLTPDGTKDLGKEGDGFRARWLPHLIDGQAQLLDGGKQPETWTRAIGWLYGERDAARRWTLTGRARTLYSQACQRWRDAQTEALPQSVIEALRKAEIQCARIALVLAESVTTDNPQQWAGIDRGTIPPDVMRSAIAITDYVMSCWRALPGAAVLTLSMAEEKLSGAADELLSWLETRPKGTDGLPDGEAPRPCATRREIQRARVGGAVTAATLSQMLAAYDARWPGNTVKIEQGGKGGGKPRVLYYFPKRTSADNDVTVTPIPAQSQGGSGQSVPGRGVADDAERCHSEGVTDSCDTDPVTPFGSAGDSHADEWPTDSGADDDAATDAATCRVCGGALDPSLVALGLDSHGEESETQ